MTVLFNIGLFDKDTKKQELKDEDVFNILANCFDCTIIKCIGVYTHNDGTKIIEPSLKVEVYDKRLTECYWIARELLTKLNQESIIISDENNTKFVTKWEESN